MQGLHVEEIRDRVEAERARISALAAQTLDSELVRNLQLASLWLKDVENFYIRYAQETFPSQTWVDRALESIACAARRREFVEKAVATAVRLAS